LSLEGAIVPRPGQYVEFQGDENSGVIQGHTGNGKRVGQTVLSHDSIDILFVRHEGEGLEVRLNHIDRQNPQQSTHQEYALVPSEEGKWNLEIPLTAYGEPLSLDKVPSPEKVSLDGSSELRNEQGVWLVSGECPFLK
jgi:hypothetical protein